MRVLIIPDVHLKHWIFDDADRILDRKEADRAVVLGDLVDDFGCSYNTGLYKETLNRAAGFGKKHPSALWCPGNHDMSYLWDIPCSGTSWNKDVQDAAIEGLVSLYCEDRGTGDGSLSYKNNVAFVHRIGDVLFSHAGLSKRFAKKAAYGNETYGSVLAVLRIVNGMGKDRLWNDESPIWLRPQKVYAGRKIDLYKPKTLLQVVGHSPMQEITQEGNLISCDTFSTYRNGMPYGNEEFCILDTESKKWESVPSSKKNTLRVWQLIAGEGQKSEKK